MLTKQKKIGRPPLPRAKRRDRQIKLRVTDELHSRLQRSANKAGVDLSAHIRDRLNSGSVEDSGFMLRDLASALRLVGDWKSDETKAEQFRATARIIIDAYTTGKLPPDLLESKRYGSTQARVLAHVILTNTMNGGR